MLAAVPLSAETFRVATWHGEFSRKHPGLLLRDLLRDDPVPGVATLLETAPDVLLLSNFDYDAGYAALGALQTHLQTAGLDLPHSFALRPNTGLSTKLDLDGDGRRGGPRDAQGYGWFSGQGGLAVLSAFPLSLQQDLSSLLWHDAPDTAIATDDPGYGVQRLSTSAHWGVDVATPDGTVTLLTLAATPPVFDGPEDRNGRRNRDEVLLWAHVLNGKIGVTPANPVIVLGNFNLDPNGGQGIRPAMAEVLGHPRLQDPLPGLTTAQWDKVGALRVSYVLPDAQLMTINAGIMPHVPEMGAHQLVWVDVTFR